MGGTARLLARVLRSSKTVVVVSWIGAAFVETWFASIGRPWRFAVTAGSFAAAFAAARLTRRVLPALLSLAYVAPVIIVSLTGAFYVGDYSLWWAPFAGAVLANERLTSWDVFGRWRAPIALWGTSIALSWPLIVLREADWNVRYVLGGRPPGSLGFNLFLGGWIAGVAGVLLLGILWFDCLCRLKADGDPDRFRRTVIWPLAVGALATFPIAIYQGWVNVAFLSGGVWPSINRAAGTLVDANAFGVLCAFWGVGWYAAARESGRLRGRYVWVIYAASWAALWATGSRTALIAGAIGALGILSSRAGVLTRRQIAAGLAALVIGIGVLHVAARSASPISRLSETFPSVTWSGIASGMQSLWVRSGYGLASAAMIRDFPLSGTGIGTFGTLLSGYLALLDYPPQPPDNAQNWFRHQIAETGFLGSMGWIVWLVMLVPVIGREWRSPRAPLAFALLGFTAASLLGMPAQNLAVTITFWTFVAWFARDEDTRREWRLKPVFAIVFGIVLVAFVGHTLAMAAGDLRPPFRAARFNRDYQYGIYVDAGSWTEKHAVIVLGAPKAGLKLTYWVEHPDAASKPVRVQIWRDHDRIVDRKLYNDVRVTTYVSVPAGRRFVLETKVDRTFRPSEGAPERGLNLKWEFVDRAATSER